MPPRPRRAVAAKRKANANANAKTRTKVQSPPTAVYVSDTSSEGSDWPERPRKRPRPGEGNSCAYNRPNVAAPYPPRAPEPFSVIRSRREELSAQIARADAEQRFHREQEHRARQDLRDLFHATLQEVERQQDPQLQIERIAADLNNIEQSVNMIFMAVIFLVASFNGGTTNLLTRDPCTINCRVDWIKALVCIWFAITLFYRLRTKIQELRDYLW